MNIENIELDTIVSKTCGMTASFGAFRLARALSGENGGAEITKGLSKLGFGGGMSTGVAVTVGIGLSADVGTNRLITKLAQALVKNRLKNGADLGDVVDGIDKFPISKALKAILKETANQAKSIEG